MYKEGYMEKMLNSIYYEEGIGIAFVQEVEGSDDTLITVYSKKGELLAITYVEALNEENPHDV